MKRKINGILALFVSLAFFSMALEGDVATKWVTVTPEAVTVHENRIDVKCKETFDNGIRFFAVSTSKADFADNVLSVLNSAILARRTVRIRYDPKDLSGSSFGCNNNDCRRLLSIQLR